MSQDVETVDQEANETCRSGSKHLKSRYSVCGEGGGEVVNACTPRVEVKGTLIFT